MSGFGIRDVAEIQRSIDEMADPILWRPESFLHQLSIAGALLWAPNHDRVWLELLGAQMGDAARSASGELSWESARERLATAEAARVRKALYRASAMWVLESERARPQIESYILTQGISQTPLLRSLDAEIQLRRSQLEQMSWCLDDSQREQIETIR